MLHDISFSLTEAYENEARNAVNAEATGPTALEREPTDLALSSLTEASREQAQPGSVCVNKETG